MERYDFVPTSDATAQYNCISWALTYELQAVWPDEDQQLGWPEALPRNEELTTFLKLFELCGFGVCDSPLLEAGIEKIALLGRDRVVKHATRQLPSGRWTSKLGSGADGEHSTADSVSNLYGPVLAYLKRVRTGQPPQLPKFNPPPARLIGPHGNPIVI